MSNQELITLQGKLKADIIAKTSVNGDDYYSVPLEIMETRKNEQKIENSAETVFLIFWKKHFDSRTQTVVGNLKADQTITVHGNLTGINQELMKVVELETEDDIFI